MKVALIGCGNIGNEIAVYLSNNPAFKIHSLTDVSEKNLDALKRILIEDARVSPLETAIKDADLIIESANKDVVKQILLSKHIDVKNKKLLVMSTGGLIENIDLVNKIKHCEVHVPSGAIAGLDAIMAVAGQINTLMLTTIKSPESLEGSPYIMENKINLLTINKKETIFIGELKDAIKGFPKNINIAASLFLASRFTKIKIKIIADPSTRFNTHKIVCTGKFGEINIQTTNYPSKNPKTSDLAIQSAISVLNNMTTNFKIGY